MGFPSAVNKVYDKKSVPDRQGDTLLQGNNLGG